MRWGRVELHEACGGLNRIELKSREGAREGGKGLLRVLVGRHTHNSSNSRFLSFLFLLSFPPSPCPRMCQWSKKSAKRIKFDMF